MARAAATKVRVKKATVKKGSPASVKAKVAQSIGRNAGGRITRKNTGTSDK
jgi:hypothetical protein